MPKIKEKNLKKFTFRPPVVVILGHVDHGKSSILQKIKEDFKILEKEAGGITQHIGAYQIEHQKKTITFIDTPGHEAFSAMRSRGAKVADIAVLVVAAEEGVKPQTKEAIKHIKKTGLPVIVAINKMDKKEAQPEKVKRELTEQEIVVESLGGQVPSVNLSAKTGQGIDELLEMINLVTEMEELKYQPKQTAEGVIIESYLDHLRGPTATLLIREGVLKKTDIVGTASSFGRIKTMEDWQSQSIRKATAGTPVIMTGFHQVPQVGEKFSIFENLEQAQQKTERKAAKRKETKEVLMIAPDKKVLNIILKADVQGSLEAIRESLQNIPSEEVVLRLLKTGVGEINESDIKLAESAQAKIIGFRVKTGLGLTEIAQRKKVKILVFDVIYELIQGVRELVEKLLTPEVIKNVLAQVKILSIFRQEKNRQVVGGRVNTGKVEKGTLIDVIRGTKRIGQGRLMQLQHNKKDVDEVPKGRDCGILFEGEAMIEKGDVLEVYREEKKKREL